MINSLTKPIQVAIHGTIMVVVFIGLSLSYQSCTKKKTLDGLTEKERAEQSLTAAAGQSSDDFFEDGDDSDDPTMGTDYNESPSADVDNSSSNEYEDSSENDDDNSVVGNATNTSTTYSAPNSLPASSGGSNLVIAGNYLIESNANAMVKKLKGKGYNSAVVRVFDLSQYYTVIAGRYDTRSLANSVSSELKNSGVDNYIIKRTD